MSKGYKWQNPNPLNLLKVTKFPGFHTVRLTKMEKDINV